MGVWYDLYLEACIEGKWRAVGPYFKDEKDEVKLASLLSGKSYVGAMLDDIDCWRCKPPNLSDELSALYGGDGGISYFPLSDINVDLRRYEYEAFVPREAMNNYQLGKVDEIEYWLTAEEFALLPAEEKLAYTYFRWSDRNGTYAIQQRLKLFCNMLLERFADEVLKTWLDGLPPARIVVLYG